MISVEGLKVEFGVKPLFHDVSFVINDRNKFENRKDFIEDCVNKMNEKYGDGTVKAVSFIFTVAARSRGARNA